MRDLEPVIERSLDEQSTQSVSESWRFTQFLHFNLQGQKKPAVNEAELARILNPSQLKRWNHLFGPGGPGGANPSLNGSPAPSETTVAQPAQESEKDEILSQIICRQMEKLSSETLQSCLNKIEDWDQALHLSPEAIEGLQLAAKGASEILIQNQRDPYEKLIRSTLARSPEESFTAKLQSVSNIPPQRVSPDQHPVWKNAVERLLSAEHQEKLGRAKQEQYTYRLRALSSLLALIAAEQIGLRKNQLGECEKEFSRMLEDYGPEFAQHFRAEPLKGIRDEIALNLHPNVHVTFLLLFLLKEENRLSFVSPAQQARFEKHQFTEQASGFLSFIQTSHRARLEQAAGNGAPR
jgi:hypothetical protein